MTVTGPSRVESWSPLEGISASFSRTSSLNAHTCLGMPARWMHVSPLVNGFPLPQRFLPLLRKRFPFLVREATNPVLDQRECDLEERFGMDGAERQLASVFHGPSRARQPQLVILL